MRVFGQLSQSFYTFSDVQQGCPISPFLFNFVMRNALAERETVGVDLMMGEQLCDLEYVGDVVCLFHTAESAQLILDRLARAVIPFGMCFAPSKCKLMYQDWDSPEPPLTLNGVCLYVVDSFTYLGGCLSNDSSIALGANAHISKAQISFANLLHLWRRKDVSLPVKSRAYNTAVRSVLLYGGETWPLCQQDVHQIEVFDHRCLRQLAKVGWSDRVSNLEVLKCVLAGNGSDTLFRRIKLCRLRWLCHDLRMEPHSPTTPGPVFNSADRVEEVTRTSNRWRGNVRWRMLRLVRAEWDRRVYLVEGPKDNSTRWLDTLKDMAMNHEQWRSCYHFLSGQIVWRWLLDRSDRNILFAGQDGVFLLIPIHICFITVSEFMMIRKLSLSTCCVASVVVCKHYCNAVDNNDDY